MARWLLKTEPGDYSYADLERDGETIWDGVRNNFALKHLRQVRAGDQALVYHTGKEKAVVGVASVASDPYPDPEGDDPRWMVFDLRPERPLRHPVGLAEIKADPAFSDFHLVRISRLSVMPVPAPLWKRLLRMSER